MSTSYTDFIKNNAAPYAASRIGVYDSSGTRVGYIPLGNLKPEYGERLYRFGLMSDVHNESDQTSENTEDLKNAIKYFNDKEDVEFAVISGDLTQYSYSTKNIATEMAIFQTNQNAVSPHLIIYPTTGNHDCPNDGSTDVDIDTFYSYTDVKDIAPASGCEFSYEVTKTHTTSGGTTVTDHFLFLTMRQYQFSTNTYSSTDLTWLGNKLEEYKNDRCFIITHMFFPDYAGNLNSIYPSGNWLSGTMLSQLQALIDAYPRSIWFSGHSHWKWYLQKYQDRANVYPTSNIGRTGGWAVHVPSCASPIDSDGTSRNSMAAQSEGGVVDVYENCIVVRGIEFKGANDSDYVHRYLPIAQYILPTDPEEASNSFAISYNLSKVTSSNAVTSIQNGNGFVTDLSPALGYSLNSIVVTMDGADISSTAVSGTRITIPSVTGDVIITASATQSDYTITYNLNDSTATNLTAGANKGDSFATEITHKAGYRISEVTVTMGGTDITSDAVTDSTVLSDKTITIDSITGDVVITVATIVAKTVLVGNFDAVSSGLALMVPDSTYKYILYSGIKITTGDGTDITSEIVTTDDSTSNSYKVGTYNKNSVYQYTPANTLLEATVNTNSASTTGYQIPIMQASSSSSVATTSIYIQLQNIKISCDQLNWIEVNDGSTILNGSSWGKNDINYGWFEAIADDPTSLGISVTGEDL